MLAILLWPVFLFWQLFPVMASAFTENVDSSNLLRFPLSFPSYFLIRIAYGSLDPATAVGSLWLLGMAIGIGVAQPAYFLVALPILFLFAVFNILLGQMIYHVGGALAGAAAQPGNPGRGVSAGDDQLSIYRAAHAAFRAAMRRRQ